MTVSHEGQQRELDAFNAYNLAVLTLDDGPPEEYRKREAMCELTKAELRAAILASVLPDPRVEELVKAVTGVMSSIEAHMYLRDPKPDDQFDEYDYMMKPLWVALDAALRAFDDKPDEEVEQ